MNADSEKPPQSPPLIICVNLHCIFLISCFFARIFRLRFRATG